MEARERSSQVQFPHLLKKKKKKDGKGDSQRNSYMLIQ